MRSTLIIIGWNEPLPDNFPRGLTQSNDDGFPDGQAGAAQADASDTVETISILDQSAMSVSIFPRMLTRLTSCSRSCDHQAPVASRIPKRKEHRGVSVDA